MNILDPFLGHVKNSPDRQAIITDKGAVSFAELDALSNGKAASFQKQGLQQGDVALVLHAVDIELYITLLALFRMGAVAMFPDPSAGLSGVKKCLEAVDVKAFTGTWKARLIKKFVPSLRKIPLTLHSGKSENDTEIILDLEAEHPALVTFTSGSTGTPKGIVRSHNFLMRQHEMVSQVLKTKEGDVDLISLPVFVLSALASGVTSVIPAGDIRNPGQIDPVPVIKQIEFWDINRMLLPPAFCQRLVESQQAIPKITHIFTGGGPVFPDLIKSLQKVAPGAEIVAAYGSTEAEPIAHIAVSEISENDFIAMEDGQGLLTGMPLEDIQIKLIDDEITVTGDHVVKSYLNKDHNSTTKIEIDGQIWHKTGDAGRFDDAGRLWLLGRIEARQGNLYPFCIETAARSLVGVKYAAFVHFEDRNILAIQTDEAWDKNTKQRLAEKFPELEIIEATIPLDKRHNSKIDYTILKKNLSRN